MKSRWNSLVVGGCNVIGLTLLALSVTAGGSTLRAGDAPVLDSVALEPLMKLADVFSQRIAKIEASVAAYTDSLTTGRVATQELCIADENGARTCITKAQLDALLKGAMQQTAQAAPIPALAPQAAPISQTPVSQEAAPVSQAPAAAEVPPAPAATPPGQAACPEKCIPPGGEVVDAVRSETPAPAMKETVAEEEKAAPGAARDVETPTAGKETSAPAAMPPHPTADQRHQATAEAPAMTETAAPAPNPSPVEDAAEKPAETIIATVAKPQETPVPADSPAKQAEPVAATPATNGSAAAAEPAAEHKE